MPKILGAGLTFDDVLLVPGYSEVLPKDVIIKTRLTKNITLYIPFISAAMDTVTENRMAIAMAQQGGIGIIHKNLSITEQVNQVLAVKRFESGKIIDPITLPDTATVGDALRIQKKHNISGVPIIDSKRTLMGIVTNRDLRFETIEKSENVSIKKVMTTKLITGTPNTTLAEANDLFRKHGIEKLPLIDKNNKLVGLITHRDMVKSREYPNATKDNEGHLRVGAAVGTGKDAMERVQALVQSGVDVICVDTAHGHSKGVLDVVKNVRAKYPNLDIIAGNIATGEAALALIRAGANAVKVGIGPGSICTTRIVAGVGAPQLSAILAVYKVCGPLSIPVIADGGIKYSGDVVKALVFGAETIMTGSTFAGTDEAPGDVIVSNDQKFKKYRGMGSVDAMQRGSRDRYFQDDQYDPIKLVPEGVSAHVPYKGGVAEVIHQYIGGLRAGMGYLGAKNISELRSASYYSITSAGLRESHIHDIFMVSPTPNYTKASDE
ncbi:IMP dehydrogenase [Candidatus Nomurabacteria bacterium RIFCSPLOWO2_02_FULL_44_12]|uniref:Inosine-5'-monophosphate dehydrogenase n=1 Tax=Candidatus Nomurabacteria bacterium RIFCSPLOWO2_12_FULL_44_11 TaxID=1801796 RepID=A0A1F6Y7Y7_9BACT|nr:MAG: IMP dehydrogenase [Candidatus Nomurabacteria bacterium RIFCSPHIGHO2_12_FULL_44_22b]OGJ02452.1 MAG: IMP dehydrogenase [Candidatus Nomurabacteria bacterium RIFCSPLOWO2_12_FULL_44_11]OGJ07067.1 MAG: IMP dehydrogenase [Candidatus Nomurabacteria bacterium RIFCSPLOWO2_02_FULL_44_12]